MAFRCPMTRYRPARNSDGEGGFRESIGTGVTIYAAVELASNKPSAIVDGNEDVVVGDILADENDARYRVTDSHKISGMTLKRLGLERMARPI
jgi:hypothetical protein